MTWLVLLQTGVLEAEDQKDFVDTYAFLVDEKEEDRELWHLNEPGSTMKPICGVVGEPRFAGCYYEDERVALCPACCRIHKEKSPPKEQVSREAPGEKPVAPTQVGGHRARDKRRR